ncbi:hypothetical protein [Neobacillus drentensis]|uniref:hypothetical protein n=1 Tax=Neobacillus drentensis TaxID=220684 RepID=UPI00285D3577|nr:hypothetical protein [Neobacillus drentensis]MDR7236653.1 chemotaxis protein histidine kinase CheA [Neobacillus drentensis]
MGLDKFSAALDLLKGFNVNLYVGEDVFKGKLIGVEADHVVLETENKYIFYYNIDKIQAITKNTRQFKPEKTTAHFLKTQSLKDLLHSFQHTWVTILSINKQKFTGVLSEIDSDFATLINGEERILIKLTHVSNILKGFIKEDNTKNSSDDEKNNNDSDDKNESKDQSSSSGDKDNSDKDDSKKDDSKKDEKSKSGTKEDSNRSDKKQKTEKSDKKQEDAVSEVIAEHNNSMVWSQPIKIESTMVQTKDEIFSTSAKPKKSSHSEEKDSSKTSSEMKMSKEDMSTRDNKSEETKSSKSKESDQSKEMKPLKESVSFQNNDNTPAPPLKLQNSEVKSTKIQDTSNPVKTFSIQNQATKKTENKAENKTNDSNTNSNSQNVWKQKEQEKKVFRFAGEPATEDNQKAFPFAGWPNRNNRATRF